jgi:hypothetical protein
VDPGPYVEDRAEMLVDRMEEVEHLGLDVCIRR